MKNVPPLPETSLDAHKRSKELSEAHRKIILEALEKHGSMTYEQIALCTNLDRHAVGRRLCELERENKIHKPGEKKFTQSGRQAFVYEIVDDWFLKYTSGEFDPPIPCNYSQKSLFP
jgi:hypothetical protein